MYADVWDKIEDLVKSITNTSGVYDKKYMIKFNSYIN